MFFIFGAFLIWTAWKLVKEARADEEETEFEENRLLKAVEKRFPATDRYHGTRLFITENGKRLMTPMLVVMLAIGTTDVLFAMDSIPAIFGLTQDPYIVFTANAFALMGLRQLYFLIGGLLKKLVHLSYGLSVILGFIGVKLVLHALHEAGVHVPEISIPVSLGVIVAVLAVTTATSLIATRGAGRGRRGTPEKARADAGPTPGGRARPAHRRLPPACGPAPPGRGPRAGRRGDGRFTWKGADVASSTGPPRADRSTGIFDTWQLDGPPSRPSCCSAAAYAYGVRRRRRAGERWPLWRTAAFSLLGLGTLVVATMSALAVYDRVLFWPAAVQNILLDLFAPLGLALGDPLALAAPGRPAAPGLRLARRCARSPTRWSARCWCWPPS